MLHTYALPSCHRELQRRQTTELVCNVRGSVYELCSCCSRRQKSTSCDLIRLYTKIGKKEGGAAMNRSVWHRITIEAAKALNIGHSRLHNISMEKVNQDNTDTIQSIVNLFALTDGYHYIVNRKRENSQCMYCSQRRHH